MAIPFAAIPIIVFFIGLTIVLAVVVVVVFGLSALFFVLETIVSIVGLVISLLIGISVGSGILAYYALIDFLNYIGIDTNTLLLDRNEIIWAILLPPL